MSELWRWVLIVIFGLSWAYQIGGFIAIYRALRDAGILPRPRRIFTLGSVLGAALWALGAPVAFALLMLR